VHIALSDGYRQKAVYGILSFVASILIFHGDGPAQNAPSGPPPAAQYVQPNSALIVEGIPPIPVAIQRQADRYT
jgi:hypothetical protein